MMLLDTIFGSSIGWLEIPDLKEKMENFIQFIRSLKDISNLEQSANMIVSNTSHLVAGIMEAGQSNVSFAPTQKSNSSIVVTLEEATQEQFVFTIIFGESLGPFKNTDSEFQIISDLATIHFEDSQIRNIKLLLTHNHHEYDKKRLACGQLDLQEFNWRTDVCKVTSSFLTGIECSCIILENQGGQLFFTAGIIPPNKGGISWSFVLTFIFLGLSIGICSISIFYISCYMK